MAATPDGTEDCGAARAWDGPALALLLAAALAFYLWLGGRSPFWGDEEFVAKRCVEGWTAFFAALRADVHPPLYFVMAKLWGRALGWLAVEPALRSLSALCAVGALYSLHRLLARCGVPAPTAWAATALCAGHPAFVIYASMAKGYAMLTLAFLLGWHAYLDLLADPASWRRRIALGLLIACLPYIHMAGGLGAAAFLAHFLLRRPADREPGAGSALAAAHGVALLAFLPQLGTTLFQLRGYAHGAWSEAASLNPLQVLASFTPFYAGTFGLASWSGWVGAGLLALGLACLPLRGPGPSRVLALTVGAAALAWVLLPWAWSFRTPCLAARATLPLLPLLLAAACLGWEARLGRRGLWLGCLALAAAWPWVLAAQARPDVHEDMRSVGTFLAQARKPGERIYLKGYLEDYYLTRALAEHPVPRVAEGPRYWLVNRLSDAGLCRGPHDCPEAYPGRYRILLTREWPSAASPAAHLVARLVEDRAWRGVRRP